MNIQVDSALGVRQIECSAGETLLSALGRAGEKLSAACGGKGLCGKCKVIADGKEVLSCETLCGSVRSVVVPRAEEIHALTKGAADIRGEGSGLGFAVDIGTTTVAAFLYDRPCGKLLGSRSGRNAQRSYGADVISRIQAWSEGRGEALTGAIRRQLSDMLDSLCAEHGVRRSDVTLVTISANTVMEHILDGLSPVGIGAAPFTPESLFGDVRPAAYYFDGLFPGAAVWLAPAVAGYVGGDITAGLCAAGGNEAEGLWLYIDLGTNGEMALGNKDGWLCCATAVGPAFEGAEISCGMDGSAGAIDKVKAENGELRVHVIGGGRAKGLCGSGLIDAASALLTLGELESNGRLSTAPRELRDGVTLLREDMRQVQLAKAAVRAGAETLLELSGHTAADVTKLVIAGGFGAFMDVKSALHIGLLPQVPAEKITHVGNAAGAGAAIALTEAGREAIMALDAKCRYFELSGAELFRDNYVEYMAFDEDE